MLRSTVVGNGGKSVVDEIRTSYGTFLPRNLVRRARGGVGSRSESGRGWLNEAS